MLLWIARRIAAAGEWGGVEVGFFHRISELMHNGGAAALGE